MGSIRLLTLAGSLLLALGCGGGGSSTPSTPGEGGGTTTYSASGHIASGGGVALPGVSVALTGLASASTATDSSGTFNFTGLANGAYTLTPSLGGYTFTPAATPFTVSSSNATGLNFTAALLTYPSTDLVNSYMTTLHSQTISQFLSDEGALSALLSSQGLYLSGSHYLQSKTDYENHIQLFLNSTLSYIQSASHTMLIDKNAIIQLLNTQKASDKAYSVTYYTGVNWQGSASVLSTITTGISTDLDNMYSLMISQVQVL